MSLLFSYFLNNVIVPAENNEYEWDDWNSTDYFYFSDEEIVRQFELVAGLACRGFTLAVAEMVAVLQSRLANTHPAIEFVDAAWTTMSDPRGCEYLELDDDEWVGPVLDPLHCALLVANDTLFEAVEDGDFATRCCWSVNLIRHLLSGEDRVRYEAWFDGCLRRLQALHRKEPSSMTLFADQVDLGELTSPETFVLGLPYDPRRNAEALSRHAGALSHENEWLVQTI
jgi:hypothetical protein